jgi:DNA-binding NarL/FixJ family response regulator
VRVEVRALGPETRAQGEQLLREVGGVEACDPRRHEPEVVVVVYAVHSPQELIALLGAGFVPAPHSVVLDLEGTLDPKVAAWLGLLGYLRRGCPPDLLRHGLEDVREGYPYGQPGFGGRFHLTREKGLLTTEEKRTLSLAARSYSREQIGEALHLEDGTLGRQITALRGKLGLRRKELLPAAATRIGFPAGESADDQGGNISA